MKIAALLVKSGADMNIKDNYNDTALRCKEIILGNAWIVRKITCSNYLILGAQLHNKDDVAEFLITSGARRGVWY